MGKIVVVGSLNMDTCYRVAHIPAPGETIIAQSVMRNPGGKGGNQAVAAAKMGADVSIVGCVGDDGDGAALRASLQAAGVDVSSMEISSEPTGSAFINVADSGENNIVAYAGANGTVDDQVIARVESLIANAQICVMQFEIPHDTVWKTVRMCKEKGVFIALNPSPVCPVPDDVLDGVDLLVPNESEMAMLLGREAQPEDLPAYAKAKGVKRILMTLGSDGCCMADANGVRHYPCAPVQAVDTTGAGDTFLGSFCAMLAEGREIEECIDIAQRAAGWAVCRMGAQQSMPLRADILG